MNALLGIIVGIGTVFGGFGILMLLGLACDSLSDYINRAMHDTSTAASSASSASATANRAFK